MMEAVQIRHATAEDFPAIDRLMGPLHDIHVTEHPEQFRPVPSAFPFERFAGMLEADDSRVFVAGQDGVVVGFVVVTTREAAPIPAFVPRRTASVEIIAVDEAERGRGIGRLLMESAATWARERGIGELELTVYEFNADAIAFYEALGMRTKSRRMTLPL